MNKNLHRNSILSFNNRFIAPSLQYRYTVFSLVLTGYSRHNFFRIYRLILSAFLTFQLFFAFPDCLSKSCHHPPQPFSLSPALVAGSSRFSIILSIVASAVSIRLLFFRALGLPDEKIFSLSNSLSRSTIQHVAVPRPAPRWCSARRLGRSPGHFTSVLFTNLVSSKLLIHFVN
jgi:hypothetical protein